MTANQENCSHFPGNNGRELNNSCSPAENRKTERTANQRNDLTSLENKGREISNSYSRAKNTNQR